MAKYGIMKYLYKDCLLCLFRICAQGMCRITNKRHIDSFDLVILPILDDDMVHCHYFKNMIKYLKKKNLHM